MGPIIPRWQTVSTISRRCCKKRIAPAKRNRQFAARWRSTKSLGPDHPDVAIRLNNLAFVLEATNRPGEAEPLYRRAAAILEKSFGADHPSAILVRKNLASLEAKRNRRP
jgi:hypothetical protein